MTIRYDYAAQAHEATITVSLIDENTVSVSTQRVCEEDAVLITELFNYNEVDQQSFLAAVTRENVGE